MDNSTVLAARDSCGIVGTSDFYGLGIRVGLYLQFITAILTKFFLSGHFHYYRDASLIFILAYFITIIRVTVLKEIYAVEIELIMWLIMPQFTIFAPTKNSLKSLSYVVSFVALSGLSGYFLWYWFVGLDTLMHTNCRDTYGFFFAKVSLYHWFRTFSKVIWVILVVCLGFSWVFILMALLGPNSDGAVASGGYQEAHSGSLLTIVAILATELTIRWNHISGVGKIDSAEQLIPLLLGLGQLVHALYKIFTTGGLDEDDEDD